ncbi:MAG: radical SAM protein [Lachnospiraceae bacterium]|nr:radical SAM protein [Lachnospiraceae bacterium]
MNKIETVWLTLNRVCNLRCNWCYAKSLNFQNAQNMNLFLAKDLVDFSNQLGINEIALIGGEPTCYEELTNLISYISNKGIDTWLITNGIKFKDYSYVEKLSKAGLTGINFSLKGWSKQSYFSNTKVDAFEDILCALKNISNSNIRCKVSFVISSDNIDHLIDIVKLAVDFKIKEFYFSFEHDFSFLDGINSQYDIEKISKIIDGFSQCYCELDKITNGNFILHQSYPLCLWDNEIIQKLTEKKQIYTSCSLIRKSGIVFDTDGSLIPCNAMYQTPIGKFGSDFKDSATFDRFWNSNKTVSIYNLLKKLPNAKCYDCKNSLICGGGCISNWAHFSYDDLVKANMIKKDQYTANIT